MTPREEFLPCPFCGGTAQGVHKDTSDPRYKPVYSVRCSCSVEIGFGYDREKVVAMWNRRPESGEVVSCPNCELRLKMLRAYEAERSSAAWNTCPHGVVLSRDECPTCEEVHVVVGEKYRCAKCKTIIQGASIHDSQGDAFHEHCAPMDWPRPTAHRSLPGDAVDAAAIARAIFKCGDEPRSKTQRIQFMGGDYPHAERGQGGLNETALTRVIDEAMRGVKSNG